MLNDVNYTVTVSKLIIENVSIPNDISSVLSTEVIIPAASVILAALTIYFTKKNLETQLKHEEKKLYIQINQQEIVSSINKLIEKVETGDREIILKFFDSKDAVFISTETETKIRNYLKKETAKVLDQSKVNKIMGMIRIY